MRAVLAARPLLGWGVRQGGTKVICGTYINAKPKTPVTAILRGVLVWRDQTWEFSQLAEKDELASVFCFVITLGTGIMIISKSRRKFEIANPVSNGKE